MTRARRSSVLALVLAAAPGCTAHEPRPRLQVPEEPAPALAEWRGPIVADLAEETASEQEAEPARRRGEREAASEQGAEPAPGAEGEAEEARPVKVAESPESDHYERGKRNARAAIARGHLGLETFGYPLACLDEYAKILSRDYGVQLHKVAGCMVEYSILEHARGYNEVMSAEITRRFGADALDRAGRKAGCL